MLKYKIIHIMPQSRFIEPFIGFIETNFDFQDHLFVIEKYDNEYIINDRSNVLKVRSIFSTMYKVDYNYASKVIIHSLFKYVPFFLYLNPKINKKSFWIIWGGDLYRYKIANDSLYNKLYEYVRKKVINTLSNFIVFMEEEFELLQKVYKVNGTHFKSFIYLSNLYHEVELIENTTKTIKILVGNSAIVSNEHIEIFERLKEFKEQDIEIIVPLSYGDHQYAKEVISRGYDMFGNKFRPIQNYMEYQKYIELLGSIDIAIFNFKRQQGIGNTNVLIGMGKTVYLFKDTSQWNFYSKHGIKVLDNTNIRLDRMDNKILENNKNILKKLFSKEALKNQLQEIFDA